MGEALIPNGYAREALSTGLPQTQVDVGVFVQVDTLEELILLYNALSEAGYRGKLVPLTGSLIAFN